jgi:hypothetical protein
MVTKVVSLFSNLNIPNVEMASRVVLYSLEAAGDLSVSPQTTDSEIRCT